MAQTDDQTFGQDSIKGKLKDDFEKFVAKGFKLIHSEPTRSSLIKAVTDNPNPMDGVSTATTLVLTKLDEASRAASNEVHDGVKIQAANIFVNDVAMISKVKVPEEDASAMLALTIQKYYKGEIKAGRVDPAELQRTLQSTIGNMSEEDQKAADVSMAQIHGSATSSQEATIQQANIPRSLLGSGTSVLPSPTEQNVQRV